MWAITILENLIILAIGLPIIFAAFWLTVILIWVLIDFIARMIK